MVVSTEQAHHGRWSFPIAAPVGKGRERAVERAAVVGVPFAAFFLFARPKVIGFTSNK
jgi:hypothetical protein